MMSNSVSNTYLELRQMKIEIIGWDDETEDKEAKDM